MEQDRKYRNKATHLQSIGFQQRCQEHTTEKEISSINGDGKTGYSHTEE
jgi:hypothetical protein